MYRALIIIASILILNCCKNKKTQETFTDAAERISIFEVYFKQPESVAQFGTFLRDTLMLPVEWEPFDFFGNGVVYDAAYYFGNTTLELLALSAGDSTMNKSARFNRVLFESQNIEKNAEFLNAKGIQHTVPFDFNIISSGSELQIGKQINLDSLSVLSNINVAFWQYENSGFNFNERSISASDEDQLIKKLENSFKSNPLGIVGLKEVHVTIDELAEEKWLKLLGETDQERWKLLNGPSISYDLDDQSLGLDWISIQVKELDKAKNFLTKYQIGFKQLEGAIELDRAEFYELNILLEE
jgi:hypothetical protein